MMPSKSKNPKPPLTVVVQTSDEPIDIGTWVRDYIARVFKTAEERKDEEQEPGEPC